MRRENRTGCVYQAKGNRRKPWGVKVPIKIVDVNGKIKLAQKFYGYFETEKEATNVLSAYIKQNQSEIDLVKKGNHFTFISIYNEWFQSIEADLGDLKRTRMLRYCRLCADIHETNIYELDQEIIEKLVCSVGGYDERSHFKSFFNEFFSYAVKQNYTAVNLARTFTISKNS